MNKRSEYHAQWRANKKKLGLCQTCGKRPNQQPWTQCEHCRQLLKKQTKDRKAKLKSNGLCIECGNATGSKKCRCPSCSKLNMTRLQTYREKLYQSGICEKCATQNKLENKRYCEKCYLKQIAKKHLKNKEKWEELQQLFKNQNTCPYTGFKLLLGINTSLDHILPKSLGGLDEINNLQFVYSNKNIDINKMKFAMNDKEFKETITIIYKNLNK